MRARRLLRSVAVAAAAALLVLGVAACTGTAAGPPEPDAAQGRDVGQLWNRFLVPAAFVFALIWGLTIWSAIRYRRRPGTEEMPPQTRYNIPLEIAYTAVPLVIVAVLFGLTVTTQRRVNRLSEDPAVTVQVEGFRWGWRFTYEGSGVQVLGDQTAPPELVVPARVPVRLELTSPDVVHSFWVPDYLLKRDVIPGTTNELEVNVDREGVYQGRCAEYCGLNHTDMGFTVRATSETEFRRWLDSRRTAPA